MVACSQPAARTFGWPACRTPPLPCGSNDSTVLGSTLGTPPETRGRLRAKVDRLPSLKSRDAQRLRLQVNQTQSGTMFFSLRFVRAPPPAYGTPPIRRIRCGRILLRAGLTRSCRFAGGDQRKEEAPAQAESTHAFHPSALDDAGRAFREISFPPDLFCGFSLPRGPDGWTVYGPRSTKGRQYPDRQTSCGPKPAKGLDARGAPGPPGYLKATRRVDCLRAEIYEGSTNGKTRGVDGLRAELYEGSTNQQPEG